MYKLTTEQRIFIVENFKNFDENPKKMVREYRKKFIGSKVPDLRTIRSIVQKFHETGSVHDVKKSQGRPLTAINGINVTRIEEVFIRSPQKSIRRASTETNISRSSIHRILKNELSWFPYKVQTCQPLSAKNMEQRNEFAIQLTEMIETNKIDPGLIWFSDEAHFWMEGYVNKQNFRFWGSENPHVSVPKSLHPKRLTVWCALSQQGIFGPHYIEGTVTSESYTKILQENFIPFLYQNHKEKMPSFYFMQDGARPHRTDQVFDAINEHFNKRVIALDYSKRHGDGIDWPPYSPDLNPMDYFLWGYLKDKVYSSNPKSLENLKTEIEKAILDITPDLLRRVISNFAIRLRKVTLGDGGHIEHVLL